MAERRKERLLTIFLGWIGPILIAGIILAILIKYQGVLTPNF